MQFHKNSYWLYRFIYVYYISPVDTFPRRLEGNNVSYIIATYHRIIYKGGLVLQSLSSSSCFFFHGYNYNH